MEGRAALPFVSTAEEGVIGVETGGREEVEVCEGNGKALWRAGVGLWRAEEALHGRCDGVCACPRSAARFIGRAFEIEGIVSSVMVRCRRVWGAVVDVVAPGAGLQ